MKLGNKYLFILVLFLIFPNYFFAEEKIITSPLLNIDEIQPSFEEPDEENEKISTSQNLKEKKNSQNIN